MSDSLQPHGLQHAKLSCPSPSPGACSSSYPLSRWNHPVIWFSVVPFSSCLQSFSASGSFPMSQFFPSCGQSIGASASASVFPMNIQDWFPLGFFFFLWIPFFKKTFYFALGYSRLTNNAVTVSGEQWRDSAIHIHVPILPQTPIPSRLPHDIEQGSMCYTVGPCWLSMTFPNSLKNNHDCFIFKFKICIFVFFLIVNWKCKILPTSGVILAVAWEQKGLQE